MYRFKSPELPLRVTGVKTIGFDSKIIFNMFRSEMLAVFKQNSKNYSILGYIARGKKALLVIIP